MAVTDALSLLGFTKAKLPVAFLCIDRTLTFEKPLFWALEEPVIQGNLWTLTKINGQVRFKLQEICHQTYCKWFV